MPTTTGLKLGDPTLTMRSRDGLPFPSVVTACIPRPQIEWLSHRVCTPIRPVPYHCTSPRCPTFRQLVLQNGVPPGISGRGPLRLGKCFSGAPLGHAPARHLDNTIVAPPTLITANKASLRPQPTTPAQTRSVIAFASSNLPYQTISSPTAQSRAAPAPAKAAAATQYGRPGKFLMSLIDMPSPSFFPLVIVYMAPVLPLHTRQTPSAPQRIWTVLVSFYLPWAPTQSSHTQS